MQNKAPVETLKPVPQRPPSSADSTSGYFSSGASYVDDQAGKCTGIFRCFIYLHQFPTEDIRNTFLLITCGLLGYDNMQYDRWVSSLGCSALKAEAIYIPQKCWHPTAILQHIITLEIFTT
jgi:hypothetical protein